MLDVGCGSAGHVGGFVSGLGPRVVGVDLSSRSAALAQRHQPGLRFVAADVQALPFASGTCGGGVAFYSLIYTADPRPALAELRRVLQRGAPLLIAVHGGEGSQRFDSYKGTAVDVEVHFRASALFAAQVRDAGFALDAVEARPPYPFEHPSQRVYLAARAS